MSDTPKFEVIDRRKMRADEEKEGAHAASPEPAKAAPAPPVAATGEPSPGPRLVVNEASREETKGREATQSARTDAGEAGAESEAELLDGLPPAPTAAESHEQ